MMLGLSPNRVIVLGFRRAILTPISIAAATTRHQCWNPSRSVPGSRP